MTDEIFHKLAKHLDSLPAGYPPTESGVEIRILKRLFTEDEAGIATGLIMMPETAGAIAQRLERDPETLAPILYDMSKKGLIYRSEKGPEPYYMAAQFVVGIWEYHVNDLDEGLIKDVNEYLPQIVDQTWVKTKTKQLRVIPVDESLSAEIKTMPYEIAAEIIKKQSKITVAPCICRKEHNMMGKGCDAPSEVCLTFGNGAYYYEQNGLGRAIDQDEALAVLQKGIDAGLVLQPGNSKHPMNICMCCGCCCQVLKNLNNLDAPAKAVISNYYAKVDAEACTACGICEERCHMNAITIDDVAQINLDRCIGCGVCVPECEFDALALKQKSEEEIYTPPENVVETYMRMAKDRGLL